VVTVRDATDDDWPAIYPFFAEIVAAGRTYAYPLDLSADDAGALWMERSPGRTFVAVDGDRVVGSAKAGPNRPGRGAHVATASFMVDPAARGRGIGRALAEHALAWAAAAGYRSMQFNAVVETNTNAVGLWQALGFRIIGTVPASFDDAEHGLVGLHVMYRELSGSVAG
jgi:ribosomal protein S18 acetylase RimI-like enzyme